MIRINVTNEDSRQRDWFVELDGDHVTLEPGDVMAIEFEHPTELVIDVTIARSRRGDLDAWSHAPRSSAARRSEAQRRQRTATTESRRLISRGDRILEIAADGPSGSSDDAIGRRNKAPARR
ncbi:hypothetical protein [Nocardia xishanensis]